MLGNLRNVDESLAQRVADELAMELPEASPAKVAPRHDLPVSDALSIVKNGPDSFAGRKIGVVVSDGTDADLLAAVRSAAEAEGTVVEIVAKAK